MLTVAVYVRWKPGSATTADRVPYSHRFMTLLKIWPVVVIFGLVMGGIAADWNWAKPGVRRCSPPRPRGGPPWGGLLPPGSTAS